jgi:hypothetical protein
MPKQVVIHAEVDRQTKTALQLKAKESKVSVSAVIRWAIQEYLDSHSKGQAA